MNTREQFLAFIDGKSSPELAVWGGVSVAVANKWKNRKSSPDFTLFAKWQDESKSTDNLPIKPENLPIQEAIGFSDSVKLKQSVSLVGETQAKSEHPDGCDCDVCYSEKSYKQTWEAPEDVTQNESNAPEPVNSIPRPETVLRTATPMKMNAIAPPGDVAVITENIPAQQPRITRSLPYQDIPSPAPTSDVNWRRSKLALMLPWYKTTNPVTAAMCMSIVKENPQTRIYLEFGDAIVQNARGKAAHDFIAGDCEWSLWIDDDIVAPFHPTLFGKWTRTEGYWPKTSLNSHFLDKLFSANKKLIGGTYFGRSIGGGVQFDTTKTQAVNYAKSGQDGVFEVDWCATGCLLVHRDVYLGIQRACPELAPITERPWWDYFAKPSGRGGEDVGFAIHAKMAGFQTYVHTGVQCGHVGFNVWNFKNV